MTELDTIKITKIDEVFIHIHADRGIQREISDRFAFFAKNYKFSPIYKNTNWDGKIRLFNSKNNTIYAGLLDEIKEYASEQDYKLELDYEDFAEKELSRIEALDFIKQIITEVKLPYFEKEIREYQLQSFISLIRNNRRLLLSPTSSGKSFLIYLLHRYYNLPTLIICDRVNAVKQMNDDLISYGYNSDNIHMIFSGQEKDVLKPIVCSTWQSVATLPEEYLNKFGVLIHDECHTCGSKTLMSNIEKMTTAKYRFGFTGTIDDSSESNPMVLTGLFGSIEKFISTTELIEQGYATPLKIKCIVLQYNKETKKQIYKIVDNKKKIDYNEELHFIENYKKRNNFIKNLACSLTGNTIVFFRHEEHGNELYKLISEELKKREGRNSEQVILSHYKIKKDNVKSILDNNDNIIGVLSYGKFQTAMSVRNIHNLIFASPSKSVVRVLQSIGRGLRLHESKDVVTLFDIADNMMIGNFKNHTIRHFKERIKIYSNENFKVKIYNVKLEE